jgi:hypothetical protein
MENGQIDDIYIPKPATDPWVFDENCKPNNALLMVFDFKTHEFVDLQVKGVNTDNNWNLSGTEHFLYFGMM